MIVTKLITAIYNRMLLATILVIAAAVICLVYYLDGAAITNSTVGLCGNVGYTDPNAGKGQKLFIENCASCHHSLKNGTGPALAGFQKRFPMDQFHSFMSDPAPLLKRNKYLRELKKQYGGIVHPTYNNLNKEQLDELLSFLTGYKN